MIPYLLAAVGGYLIGDSINSEKFAFGGFAGQAFNNAFNNTRRRKNSSINHSKPIEKKYKDSTQDNPNPLGFRVFGDKQYGFRAEQQWVQELSYISYLYYLSFIKKYGYWNADIHKKVMEFEKQNKEKENRDLIPSEYLEYERQTTN